MRKLVIALLSCLVLLIVCSNIIIIIKYQNLRKDIYYQASSIEFEELNLVKNNYLISSEIESNQISEDFKIFTRSGDSLAIKDILDNGSHVIIWATKDFCQKCIYETIYEINNCTFLNI